MTEQVDIYESATRIASGVSAVEPRIRKRRRPLPSRLARFLLNFETLSLRLATNAGIRSGEQVLHLGCGSGDQLVALVELCPGAVYYGLESDQHELAQARVRANTNHRRIAFRQGLLLAPPYPPSSFHHVVLTPVLRGLSVKEKQIAWAISCRLLKPGGVLHTIDWGQPRSVATRIGLALMSWACGLTPTLGGGIKSSAAAAMMRCGFASVETVYEEKEAAATLAVYRAQKHSRSRM